MRRLLVVSVFASTLIALPAIAQLTCTQLGAFTSCSGGPGRSTIQSDLGNNMGVIIGPRTTTPGHSRAPPRRRFCMGLSPADRMKRQACRRIARQVCRRMRRRPMGTASRRSTIEFYMAYVNGQNKTRSILGLTPEWLDDVNRACQAASFTRRNASRLERLATAINRTVTFGTPSDCVQEDIAAFPSLR